MSYKKYPTIDDYTLHHPLDRRGQTEAFEVLQDWYYNSDKRFMIFSAPTGVGKTGIVSELSRYARTLALVRTKVLQDDVYASYRYRTIKGKRNYPCKNDPRNRQADVCNVSKEYKGNFCIKGGCQYYVELDKFTHSFRAATTYSKYLADKGKTQNYPDLFVCDEAHELSELVIDSAGLQVSIKYHPFMNGFGDYQKTDYLGFDDTIKLLRKMYQVAKRNAPKIEKSGSHPTKKELIKHQRAVIRHSRFLSRIEETANYIKQSERDDLNIWHSSISGPDGDILIKPMTAAYHFRDVMLFNESSSKVLLMSATISEYEAELLGIQDDYQFYEAPQQYPTALRPIYDLGQPGMGVKNLEKNPSLFNIQAVRISTVLKMRPDVSSVILTTSKEKACIITEHLTRMGHNVFNPPADVGTDLQLAAWESCRKPGAVCVSYNFWVGVNLSADKMLFLANVKYPDLRIPFERDRLDRSPREFNYRAAVYAVQGAGRIQRGYREDYLPMGNKMVFIVDGNFKKIKSFAPGDFAERIIPWPGRLPGS